MSLSYYSEQDQQTAAAFWRDKEVKVFAVDVTGGPEKKPTYASTWYARARSRDRAIECVKRECFGLPSRARFRVRLAGPKELGCHPTGATS